jgi:hypothetical protein
MAKSLYFYCENFVKLRSSNFVIQQKQYHHSFQANILQHQKEEECNRRAPLGMWGKVGHHLKPERRCTRDGGGILR